MCVCVCVCACECVCVKVPWEVLFPAVINRVFSHCAFELSLQKAVQRLGWEENAATITILTAISMCSRWPRLQINEYTLHFTFLK